MANKNLVINGVVYSEVPIVQIPISGGGTASYYDVSDGDITSADVLAGKIGYNASGVVNGSMVENGSVGGTISTKAGTITIPAGHTTGGTVSLASSAVSDLVAGNLLSGKTVLGISGTLNMPSISQDSTTKILSIS